MAQERSIPQYVEFTSKASLLPDLAEAWRYRWMAVALARRNLMTRYTQTLLGPGWFFLQPIMLTGILSLVMGGILHVPSGGMPYVVFAASGTILWSTFNRSLLDTSMSLAAMAPILSKVYFPRILIPVAALFSSALEVLPAYGLLVLLVGGYRLLSGWPLLLCPLFVVMTLLLTLAVGLWLTVFDAYFRDVRYALPFILQFVFFFSPIIYSSSAIPSRWRMLFQLNPITALIDGFRWSLVSGAPPPSAFEVVWAIMLILIAALSGLVIFGRHERILVDRI